MQEWRSLTALLYSSARCVTVSMWFRPIHVSLIMSLLDFPFERYPRTWGEMSYDFKLMFVYHGSMMLLFATGQNLSLATEVIIAAVVLSASAVLAVKHRRRTPWVWLGISWSRLLGAVATVLLGGLFLSAAVPLFPPTNPGALPWYLAGLGIILFSTLHTLRLVAFAEADYFTSPAPRRSAELAWRRLVRLMFGIFFLVVWLDGVASFYYFGVAVRDGSPIPTAAQTEPLSNHGKVVYVAPSQKRLITALQTRYGFRYPIGVPSWSHTALRHRH
jgi:hypothetical protein